MTKQSRSRAALAAAAVVLATGTLDSPARGQWVRQHEQFYLPASHNWVFRRSHPAADRLFNAFDYGHAILYERLYTRPGAPASELEEREYAFITRRLLTNPPRLPVEEGAIESAYARLAPEAKLMFEWAHILHRQMYDVLADERLSQAEKDAEVAALLRYYRSRPDLAFSRVPKSMELMEGQHYSTVFREGYPRFNGLIWGYHWLQVGLYEPLMVGRTAEERQTGVAATVARFRQMLEDAPRNLPRVMPMTAAVSPVFAARYPEAAIIFDNLHGMHDVISDILASPAVPRERKREEILRAAKRYRDDTSFVMTRAEWLGMSRAMGVENMGGPAVGLLSALPEATVERGAMMAHGAMDHAGMRHGAPSADPQGRARGMDPAPSAAHSPAPPLGEVHERLMADPVIREHVAADSALRRMMAALHGPRLPADHGRMDHEGMDHEAAGDSARVLDFVVRLLADPAMEARVRADPRLRPLWSDPEVQRRVAALRRTDPGEPHRH